jgi:RNA polymerase sigma-70 factor (ECF subfamily)
VPLEAAALAAHLGERAPADSPAIAWLEGLPAADVFLACACAVGVPEAVRAFDAAFLENLEASLRQVRASADLVAETRQVLLEKLFVGSAGRPPKILAYTGQGALGGWARVAAVRTALNLLDKEKAGSPRVDDAEAIARAFVPEKDLDLELMRARHAGDFVEAFRAAIAGLPRRDRTLLRLTFVEHLTPARVGVMYGVHRTTAMRWIDAAQEEVLARTRARLMERLRLSPSECDGLFALVRSRLDVTLSSLLKTGS